MKPYAGTQAPLRAVRLLKAFTAEQPRRGLLDLAKAVGLNKTTAYRLLTALESEGMVERADGGYGLGPELLALGARALGASELRQASRPELQALAAATRETATLEVLVGREALILDEVAGTHRVGTMPSVGTRWPAHAASTGKAILAFLPEDEQAAFLRGRLAALTSRTITEPGAFRRELARVSGRGWSLNAEELEEGFVAVGAPVRSGDGRVTAAISVGGPRARLLPERVAELARLVPAAAARISERLGATRVPPPRTSNRKARA